MKAFIATEEDVIRYKKLENENQKLRDLLDLAMGDEWLGFYKNIKSYTIPFSEFNKVKDGGRVRSFVEIDNGKRAQATREEILKQLGGLK
jgi:hypothetical protein